MGKKKNKNLKNKILQNKNELHGNSNDKENYQENNVLDINSEKIRMDFINEKSNIPNVKDDETNGNIKFEKYYGKSERITGREYFVHSLCQVCKEEVSEREGCSRCGMVWYCSAQHRREHWPAHADLCATMQAMALTRGGHIMAAARDLSPDKFRIFRFQNMIECEMKVERPLEKWEREMFIFPNVCGKCHNQEVKDLITCRLCRHSGFCKNHEIESHSMWCGHLLRYKNIVKNQNKFGVVCPSIPNCKMSTVWPSLTNIEDFFHSVSSSIDEFEFFELTEIATYPLTALSALLKMNSAGPFNKDKLTLHVVGAEADFETNKLEKWEYYLLHLIPNLKHLRVEFAGPELNARQTEYKVCSKCSAANKSITFGFYNQLYHKLRSNQGFSKPDLICVFNPGLYRVTGFHGQDSWGPCLPRLVGSGCPLLSTAYSAREMRMDLDRLRASTPIHLLSGPDINPFASLKPNLNFVSEEESPVIFKNQFYCVISQE